MLNYKSVRSSEPQIRSNPALRQISSKSGFQKRLETLLEPIPLPFPTFQIMRDNHQPFLQTHHYYAWMRPAHLRAQWLILTPDMPLLMMDPKNPSNLWSLRIPFDTSTVQKIGPIVCEGAWDAQDHVLYIWDVVIWEKENVWSKLGYKKRWGLVETVCKEILDIGHPMSDAEVRVPEWISLQKLSTIESIDSTFSIEFQPEKEGQKRLLFLVQNTDKAFTPTTHHERKAIANGGLNQNQTKARPTDFSNSTNHVKPSKFVKPVESSEPVFQIQLEESIENIKPTPSTQTKKEVKQPRVVNGESISAKLIKDKTSKLLDTFQLQSLEGTDLGYPAIRSLEVNKLLREAFKTREEVSVRVAWFEPFQKYEIQAVL